MLSAPNRISVMLRPVGIGILIWLVSLAVFGNPIVDWNNRFLDAIRADTSPPTLASRNLAILHTAIYDAVNSVERTHQQYRYLIEAPAGASSEAAVVGA